jgi:SAM-dependent methyltransferase
MSITLDETRLEAFAGLVATDIGAALNVALVTIGDRLGLYRAMADGQPVSAGELAARTSTHERYIREWLNTQAASGFVTYDPAGDRYTLPLEHAFALTDENGPVAMAGIFQSATAVIDNRERIEQQFLTGGGVGWHEHTDGVFCGVERVFAGSYRANLVSSWLPAVDGAVDALRRGGRVLDLGCGHGAATILLAQAFPNASFVGIDNHVEGIETARERARAAGVAERVDFAVATAQDFPGGGYDLVCFFDALHDMGDPVGAARRARQALADDGVCMIVEPYAEDRIEDNLTPVGRMYYGYSTLLCTPGALSQDGGTALGTQAGEARLTEVLLAGGFGSVRRVAETPLNFVLEARP